MKLCPKCNRTYSNNYVHCESCGGLLINMEEEPAVQNPKLKPEPKPIPKHGSSPKAKKTSGKNKNQTILFISLFLLLSVFLIIGAILGSKKVGSKNEPPSIQTTPVPTITESPIPEPTPNSAGTQDVSIPSSETENPNTINMVTDRHSSTSHVLSTYVEYHIPQINLDFANIKELNNTIYNELSAIMANSSSTSITCNRITYNWAVNNTVLSLWIKTELFPDQTPYNDYKVYNIDISTGEILTDSALLEKFGWVQALYQGEAQKAMGSYFIDIYGQAYDNGNFRNQTAFFFNQFAKTISIENVNDAEPFINNETRLCIVGKIHSMAGAVYYEQILDLSKYTKSARYDDFVSRVQ